MLDIHVLVQCFSFHYIVALSLALFLVALFANGPLGIFLYHYVRMKRPTWDILYIIKSKVKHFLELQLCQCGVIILVMFVLTKHFRTYNAFTLYFKCKLN